MSFFHISYINIPVSGSTSSVDGMLMAPGKWAPGGFGFVGSNANSQPEMINLIFLPKFTRKLSLWARIKELLFAGQILTIGSCELLKFNVKLGGVCLQEIFKKINYKNSRTFAVQFPRFPLKTGSVSLPMSKGNLC